MLVPGSRPASRAFSTAPPATISSNSSRRGSDCSEASATSGCHSVALRWRVSESRMAASAPRTAAARSASAPENCWRRSVVMEAKIEARPADAYRPEGRVLRLRWGCLARTLVWGRLLGDVGGRSVGLAPSAPAGLPALRPRAAVPREDAGGDGHEEQDCEE